MNGRQYKKDILTIVLILSIVATLAAILVPNFVRARSQGRSGGSCKSNLKNIATGLEMYAGDNGGKFPRALSGFLPTYLRSMPTCPSVGRDTYSEGYVVSMDPPAFTVACIGANHRGVGVPENFPQYNSRTGLMEK